MYTCIIFYKYLFILTITYLDSGKFVNFIQNGWTPGKFFLQSGVGFYEFLIKF